MRALVQTVSRASVTIDDEVVGAIEDGLLVLLGVTHTDTAATAARMARKVHELRILGPRPGADQTAPRPGADQTAPRPGADQTAPRPGAGEERAEQAAADVGAPVLVVSQFTLYGDARKGRRPTWAAAAPAEVAEPLVTEPLVTAFAEALRARGAKVETGRFRAHMLVESVNVGPRTVLLEL